MKKEDEVFETTTIANLSRVIFVGSSIFLGIVLIVIGSLVNIDSSRPASQIMQTVSLSIGTSIVSSVIFYLLYSWTAEEKVLKNVSNKVTKEALTYAHKLYVKNYEFLLPTKLYPETKFPLKEYNDHFNLLLKQSSLYYCKSFAGEYFTYRLHSNLGDFNDKDVKIMIADPREGRILQCRALMSKKGLNSGSVSREVITQEVERIREEIFTTLYSLFDCRSSKVTEVYFHIEYPFSRVEFFEQGLFITYYYGGEWPHTYFYNKSTFIYCAHQLNFRQNYEHPNNKIRFDDSLTEIKFYREIKKYGYKLSLDALKESMNKRMEEHSKRNIL